jgi:hypothetical protein
MSVSEVVRDLVDESVESMELAPRINGFHLESSELATGPCLLGTRTN